MMSSTCFKPESSSSGRRLFIQIWYHVFHMLQYKQSCRYKSVFGTVRSLIYKRDLRHSILQKSLSRIKISFQNWYIKIYSLYYFRIYTVDNLCTLRNSVTNCTAHSTHHNWKHFYQHCWTFNDVSLKNIVTLARFDISSLMMVQMDRNMLEQ